MNAIVCVIGFFVIISPANRVVDKFPIYNNSQLKDNQDE